MKTLLLLLLLPLFAHAHIGSPNVFFEGHAGRHAVRVSIRPPTALPGFAQVDVRVAEDAAHTVSVQAVLPGASAPAPVTATPVTGDARLFHTPIWLLRRGTYAFHIAVDDAAVVVPLQASALARPDMPPALGLVLSILGVVLFISAVWITHAAVPRRGSALVATLLLSGALGAGAARWGKMDREFRGSALAQPRAVTTGIRTDGSTHLLRLTRDTSTTAAWDTLAADHGKLMHLFLIGANGGNNFAHLHPVRRDGQTFESVLPPLAAGAYDLYGEITYANGSNETLTAHVTLPAPLGTPAQTPVNMANEVWCQSSPAPVGNAAQPFALDADDSWHAGPPPAQTRISPLMGGHRMVFQNAGELVANRDITLRFAVVDSRGESVALQPYMSMLGHAVVRRDDGAVFTHLHPLGTISMAVQDLLSPSTPTPAPPPPGTHEVTFPYAFPRPGDYRLWVQVRVNTRVVTGVFEVRVIAD